MTNSKTMIELGIAAGLMAMVLFALLYATTGHAAVLVAGCGGGLLLLTASLLAAQRLRVPPRR